MKDWTVVSTLILVNCAANKLAQHLQTSPCVGVYVDYIQGVSPKCIHLTADSSILKMKCSLINTAFIIIQNVYIHFWGTPNKYTHTDIYIYKG